MADIDLATAALDRFGHLIGKSEIYATVSELGGVPETTLWHCAHSRALIKQKGQKQQYLTI
jgi:hypothetical protein